MFYFLFSGFYGFQSYTKKYWSIFCKKIWFQFFKFKISSSKLFSKLDLRNAYNLIRIRSGDEWRTAFSTSTGHYEYSIFQSFINDIFRDMLDHWVIVYIDDILLYSDTYEEHVQHVRRVLQRLIDHRLYAKAKKCEFHQTSTSFLGYIINQRGVAMDEKKVRAVLDWPQPATLKELQRFLGFANFYRRFIRNFSFVVSPLTSMTKINSSHLTWSALEAFTELKTRFTSAPILHHPDPEQRHGCTPELHPCAYFSHKLSSAEQNYDVRNRELLAMKSAMEEWRHWLEGSKHPFVVLTDHKNLEYLRSAKRLNPRQARWALFF